MNQINCPGCRTQLPTYIEGLDPDIVSCPKCELSINWQTLIPKNDGIKAIIESQSTNEFKRADVDSSLSEFGEPRTVSSAHPPFRNPKVYVFIAVFSCLVVFFFLIIAAVLGKLGKLTAVFSIGMVLACLIFGISVIGSIIRGSIIKRFLVFDRALVHINGDAIIIFPWNDIAAVWQRITENYYNFEYIDTSYIYTIQRLDGVQIVLDSQFYANVEELGEIILKETTPRLLNIALQSINAGESVCFGPLSVTRNGIHNGNSILPWNEIKGIQVEKGVISVCKEGNWFTWAKVRTADIANFFVFFALVERITGIKN